LKWLLNNGCGQSGMVEMSMEISQEEFRALEYCWRTFKDMWERDKPEYFDNSKGAIERSAQIERKIELCGEVVKRLREMVEI
jgi:hypothetical protein